MKSFEFFVSRLVWKKTNFEIKYTATKQTLCAKNEILVMQIMIVVCDLLNSHLYREDYGTIKMCCCRIKKYLIECVIWAASD